MKDNLIRKFLKFSYGSWVGVLLGLVTTMIITRLLPAEALGMASLYTLFIQFGMIFAICGTDQAFGRFFYEEEEEKRGFLLYNSIKLPLLNSVIIVILILYFYKPITLFLFDYESLPLACLLGIGIMVQVVLRFSQLVIRMQQKANLYSLLQIFSKIFNLILTILFFYALGDTFKVLIFSEVTTFFAILLIGIYFGRNFWSLHHFKGETVKHSQKDIFKFGIPFVFTIFITWVFEGFDKIALRQWSTYEELGMYTAAMRLAGLLLILKATFSTFWTPVAYEKFGNEKNTHIFFKYISIIVSFAMFFVAIVSIAFKDLLVMLLGNEYNEAANILPFLVFIPLLYTISETTVIGINFYKKINWHIFIAVVCCLVNILGNWLLVPNYGAIGASFSTAITFIIFFTLRTFLSLKYFKVGYPLIRIYSMLFIIFLYAGISLIVPSFWVGMLIAIIPLIFMILLFYNDLIFIYKNKGILFA